MSMRICLFGADPDTGNLGVSALLESVVTGVRARRPDAQFTVFDKARGYRPAHQVGPSVNGRADLCYDRCAARLSFKLYEPDSLFIIRAAARLGGLNNTAARLMREADAIFDISGGDSFTDLYGWRRFNSVTFPKLIAIEQRVPLVLLPQTYGPFRSPRSQRTAAHIVRNATSAWARDRHSYEALIELAGGESDKYHCGVDVAFTLEPQRPDGLDDEIERWLSQADSPIAGLNVSGLLYHDPGAARNRYGFVADYERIVLTLAERLLAQSNARLLLVPHVIKASGHYESDPEACAAVREALRDRFDERITVAPTSLNAAQMKWLISQSDWFCGTRMHSTIAALSTGVPAAAIAYSPKTAGVFATCGLEHNVADPRTSNTNAVVEQLWRAWLDRDESKKTLDEHLPAVLETAEREMDEIAGAKRNHRCTQMNTDVVLHA